MAELFRGCGLDPAHIVDPSAKMSRRQRLIIYRNAQRLSSTSEIGLLAGRHQRLSDFGVYGYAFASCETLGDAMLFSIRNMSAACPVMQVRYRTEGHGIVLSSHGSDDLSDILPFIAEYWRSSMQTLINRATGGTSTSCRMLFPYAAPRHWRLYEEIFECPVDFDTGVMEWHFDESTLARPLPDANPVNASLLEALCVRLIENTRGASGLERRIRLICTESPAIPAATEMATRLGLSSRSMFRRLTAEATTYQLIVDDVRRTLAMDLLRDPTLSLEVIGQRLGFTEATNFSKAFRRWTGMAPSEYRQRCAGGTLG
ncbi:MAG TPA: AraC family transcriptional regulator ligand-binding domain-containing protein [Sphingobium sp.]